MINGWLPLIELAREGLLGRCAAVVTACSLVDKALVRAKYSEVGLTARLNRAREEHLVTLISPPLQRRAIKLRNRIAHGAVIPSLEETMIVLSALGVIALELFEARKTEVERWEALCELPPASSAELRGGHVLLLVERDIELLRLGARDSDGFSRGAVVILAAGLFDDTLAALEDVHGLDAFDSDRRVASTTRLKRAHDHGWLVLKPDEKRELEECLTARNAYAHDEDVWSVREPTHDQRDVALLLQYAQVLYDHPESVRARQQKARSKKKGKRSASTGRGRHGDSSARSSSDASARASRSNSSGSARSVQKQDSMGGTPVPGASPRSPGLSEGPLKQAASIGPSSPARRDAPASFEVHQVSPRPDTSVPTGQARSGTPVQTPAPATPDAARSPQRSPPASMDRTIPSNLPNDPEHSLIVSNLPLDTTKNVVLCAIGGDDGVSDFSLERHLNTLVAHVTFRTEPQARAALRLGSGLRIRGEPVVVKLGRARPHVGGVSPTSLTPSAPPPVQRERRNWRTVFDEFFELKRSLGESTAGLTYERFEGTLRKNEAVIQTRHGVQAVSFSVYVEAGKAALRARPVRDEASVCGGLSLGGVRLTPVLKGKRPLDLDDEGARLRLFEDYRDLIRSLRTRGEERGIATFSDFNAGLVRRLGAIQAMPNVKHRFGLYVPDEVPVLRLVGLAGLGAKDGAMDWYFMTDWDIVKQSEKEALFGDFMVARYLCGLPVVGIHFRDFEQTLQKHVPTLRGRCGDHLPPLRAYIGKDGPEIREAPYRMRTQHASAEAAREAAEEILGFLGGGGRAVQLPASASSKSEAGSSLPRGTLPRSRGSHPQKGRTESTTSASGGNPSGTGRASSDSSGTGHQKEKSAAEADRTVLSPKSNASPAVEVPQEERDLFAAYLNRQLDSGEKAQNFNFDVFRTALRDLRYLTRSVTGAETVSFVVRDCDGRIGLECIPGATSSSKRGRAASPESIRARGFSVTERGTYCAFGESLGKRQNVEQEPAATISENVPVPPTHVEEGQPESRQREPSTRASRNVLRVPTDQLEPGPPGGHEGILELHAPLLGGRETTIRAPSDAQLDEILKRGPRLRFRNVELGLRHVAVRMACSSCGFVHLSQCHAVAGRRIMFKCLQCEKTTSIDLVPLRFTIAFGEPVAHWRCACGVAEPVRFRSGVAEAQGTDCDACGTHTEFVGFAILPLCRAIKKHDGSLLSTVDGSNPSWYACLPAQPSTIAILTEQEIFHGWLQSWLGRGTLVWRRGMSSWRPMLDVGPFSKALL